ncbi:hypothetical protein [Pseudosporangium ferrugineum]|uniref:Glycerophosphoryl diester phosphodiesterase family protein n=1 Tax=Pseudosporangium ferrugineum TaxID=439699 RepID=A0A2T0SBL0_9ACTN|nr:hypothetical protein [Pseudosporangium ferrugineum]PRY30810.1 hypothetical protein CLV70_104362 [Pseudosporangium ferrugineum]
MREPLSPWWAEVQDAAQLLASQLNAYVTHAARVGVYTAPPGSPPPRRRRQPGSLRHLAEVIRTHRLAPGRSVDKDDVAAVLAGDPHRIADPVLVVAVARASHLIAGEPFGDAGADRLVVASTHVSSLADAAREADGNAPRAVPALRPAGNDRIAGDAGPIIIDAHFTTRRPGRGRALIAGALSALVLAGAAAVLVLRRDEPDDRLTSAEPVVATVAGVTPLEHGHAQNDHLNARPLLDALDRGFTSVGTDVLLRDDTLVLCHRLVDGACRDSRGTTITARPFEPAYLQRFSARVKANGGRVYPGFHQPVLLFVGIGCAEGPAGCTLPPDPAAAATDPNNPLVVVKKLMSALAPYRDMLYHVDRTARRWGPVQIVVTGSHNDDRFPVSAGGYDTVRGILQQQSDIYTFLDGSFDVDGDQYNADLVPVISFENPAGCAKADETPVQTRHWDDIVTAQSTGHHVRLRDVADCPDRGSSWTDALYAGVDYIGSDHVAMLGEWIAGTAVGGGGGDCAVPSWIATARLYGQYCTLVAGKAPVMSRPDPASARVGTLAHGGANWFLGQQPGKPHTRDESTNFWWAYTRASNGRWGWVSLTYFTNGVLDQSADGLQYACYDVRPGEPDNCHAI